jgi:hypothetical protein
MTPEEFHLSVEKDYVLRQAYDALEDMRYALRRAEDTMRQPTKYIAEAQAEASKAMTAIKEVLEKP